MHILGESLQSLFLCTTKIPDKRKLEQKKKEKLFFLPKGQKDFLDVEKKSFLTSSVLFGRSEGEKLRRRWKKKKETFLSSTSIYLSKIAIVLILIIATKAFLKSSVTFFFRFASRKRNRVIIFPAAVIMGNDNGSSHLIAAWLFDSEVNFFPIEWASSWRKNFPFSEWRNAQWRWVAPYIIIVILPLLP